MKRVLLKLSGEALAGDKHTGFDEPTVTEVAKQVKQIVGGGTEVGIVIGGGNFWRGRTSETIDRTKADQIGMLATIMNCIYVSEIFRSVGMQTQGERVIHTFRQIRGLFCVRLRWRRTESTSQKRLTACMIVIRS